MRVLALFGPTGVGKTGAVVELSERLRERGEDPVAVNCDALQVYGGLELATAAPTPADRAGLEHRLVGIVPASEEFSVGRYARLAHAEIDGLLERGRRPLVVGGTGLYLRAALSELDLRPPVPVEVRRSVEAEIEKLGSGAVHEMLAPEIGAGIHPNDRKRIARARELARIGAEPHRGSEQLWSDRLRHPTALVGLVMEREALDARIERRVEAMFRAGAAEQVATARREGLSRTASGLLGLEGFIAGDRERVVTEHRRFARRQMTWMRKMPNVTILDRSGLDDVEVAVRLEELLDR